MDVGNAIFYDEEWVNDPFAGVDTSHKKYEKRDDESEREYSMRVEELMSNDVLADLKKNTNNSVLFTY